MPKSIKLHRQLQTTHDVYTGDGQLPTFPPFSPLLLQTPVMNWKTLPAGCWQPRQHTSEENNTQLWTSVCDSRDCEDARVLAMAGFLMSRALFPHALHWLILNTNNMKRFSVLFNSMLKKCCIVPLTLLLHN